MADEDRVSNIMAPWPVQPVAAATPKKRARGLLPDFEKADVNQSRVEKRCVASENLFTFDYQSAAVQKHRTNVNMMFEAFVKATYFPDSEPTEAQIWSLDTVMERTKDVILRGPDQRRT